MTGRHGGRRTHLGPVAPVLTAGVLVAVVEVFMAVSMAALVFGGPLADDLPKGVGLLLASAIVLLVGTSVLTSVPGVLGSVQDGTTVLVALVATSTADLAPDRRFDTVVAAMASTSALVAVLFAVLGTARLGALARYVPYPVVGGFLAGTGWLLVDGGLGILTPTPVTLSTLDDLLDSGELARWAPGVAFAAVMLLLLRRRPHPLLLPGGTLVAVAVVYAGFAVSGTSLGAAESRGLLLGPLPGGARLGVYVPGALAGADWPAIASQAGTLATLLVVSLLAVLMNASGIELIVRRDLDLDRELRAAGGANAVVAALGGAPGFHALSLTALVARVGALSRVTGVLAAGVCALVLVLGADAVGYLPRAAVGGLVLLLGVSFLVEWAVDARRAMPALDHGVVLAILVTVVVSGFLVGVAVGIGLAVLLFAVRYSRIDPVRRARTLTEARSNVDRPAGQREALRTDGPAVHVLELQGFVFFGTASRVIERLRARVAAEPPLVAAVVDLAHVSGMDSSAAAAFARAVQITRAAGAVLAVSGGAGDLRRLVPAADDVRLFPDLDHALEWCEEVVLARRGEVVDGFASGPLSRLLPALAPYVEPLDLPAGCEVISQDDADDALYLVEQGEVTARLRLADGGWSRLRRMGPGTAVGEIGLYLGEGRTASVRTERPCRIHRLSAASLARLAAADPALAAELHRTLATLLARRVVDANRAKNGDTD